MVRIIWLEIQQKEARKTSDSSSQPRTDRQLPATSGGGFFQKFLPLNEKRMEPEQRATRSPQINRGRELWDLKEMAKKEDISGSFQELGRVLETGDEFERWCAARTLQLASRNGYTLGAAQAALRGLADENACVRLSVVSTLVNALEKDGEELGRTLLTDAVGADFFRSRGARECLLCVVCDGSEAGRRMISEVASEMAAGLQGQPKMERQREYLEKFVGGWHEGMVK